MNALIKYYLDGTCDMRPWPKEVVDPLGVLRRISKEVMEVLTLPVDLDVQLEVYEWLKSKGKL